MKPSTSKQSNSNPQLRNSKQQNVSLRRNDGSQCTGVYVDTGNEQCVVFVHDWLDSQQGFHFPRLATELGKKGFCSLSFDANCRNKGELILNSLEEGLSEVRNAVQFVKGMGKKVVGLVGHGFGGSKVVMYAKKYDDVDRIININGIFDFKRFLNDEVGQDNIRKLQQTSQQIHVQPTANRQLQKQYKLTRQDLNYYLELDMKKICSSISMSEVLTLHGADSSVVPVQDAKDFAKHIGPHLLNIIQGADYQFSDAKQQDMMITKILDFLL